MKLLRDVVRIFIIVVVQSYIERALYPCQNMMLKKTNQPLLSAIDIENLEEYRMFLKRTKTYYFFGTDLDFRGCKVKRSTSLFGHESDINMLKFIIKHIDPLLAILYRSTYIQVTGPYSKPGNYNRRTKIRAERGYTFHVKVPVMTTLKTDNTGNGW
ncbi:unnamed protein product [Acanthoscelides obtectus]|uniref:Uncharacterized protein n=1 Tax=Acanthoscelides obtectus TaxID=200917 RepID=A0A9P0KN25_ACAOB|nr:unnamed protein product [Acanthoscelides obtectus]CAK1635593.1 hypothetical protein AOBTE_LOCUS9374 [Acanthoscelides obtectus]